MKGHAVEVGHDLINRDWGGTVNYDQTGWFAKKLVSIQTLRNAQ